MIRKALAGVLPVLQTPFTEDDRIDSEIVEREIEWLFQHRVNGVVLGMVTETPKLTEAERDGLVRQVVQATRGRGPVVASVGGESSVQALRHARAAQEAGADALMATPPAMTRASQEEIFAYYDALVRGTERTVIIQDASAYFGNSIPVSLQAKLYRSYPGRIAFKPEAQPLAQTISALRDATGGEAALYDGSGGLALVDNFRRGVVGTMPGSDIPWAMVALWEALQSGDEKRVAAIQGPLLGIVTLQTSLGAFLRIEKLFLHRQGIFPNTRLRAPAGFTLDPETEREALRLFDRLREACR